MRSIWMKLSLAVALLGVVPLASAAGFDCAKAKSTVEQKICADPELSQLDSQMAQAFERARAKAASQLEALLRDQRNWLSERNEAVFGPGGASLYQERIAFLQHVFDTSPKDAPLPAAIAKYLTSQSPGAPSWESDGAVFKTATEQSYDPTRSLPFDTGPLTKLVGPAGQFLNPELDRLDAFRLGALSSQIMFGNCEGMVFYIFSWRDRVVQPAPVPAVFDRGCVSLDDSYWSLVEFEGHAYALSSHDDSAAANDIEVQQWDGSNWADPNRVHVRYDYHTSLEYVHCAWADCTGLSNLASKTLERYVRDRDPDALSGHIPADAQAQFEAQRKLAEQDTDVQYFSWGETVDSQEGPESYYADHKDGHENGFSGFMKGVFFPIRWHGEWLLGCIGHASFVTSVSDDWLLGIWRRDGDEFVPILGIVAPTQRTRFLLAAWLPDARPNSN
ncbi:DUF1311 domain-containing protein [Rhodanobacter sp. 7MK24]|uniref:lysozyme inhibitor LprI family protein n=1 Tax=Rhodanobacter sp. 7MK24 TaxID=2775922 RepID=UPI00178534DB|nr:lysozyme inhibitor LprI family protein [Rhodanobacter sp. 7MK24]MBD8881518.1 DUF1311 domain-containing protein [Rhodanobacter sp. 7MK24]